MSIHDTQRVSLFVLAWDNEKQAGLVRDDQNCRYVVRAESLDPAFGGKLHSGEEIVGVIKDFLTAVDLMPAGKFYDHDRPAEEDSAGPGAERGWEPRTGNPGYANGGHAVVKPGSTDPRNQR